MNRRTFTKYLLAIPIALATLLTRPLTSSVSPAKEKDEEPSIKEGRLVAIGDKWYVYYDDTSWEEIEWH